ncbi:MAG: hypothetical protein L0Z55_00645 [Planctomycetes bacterium]|nr:hypothetical protein [Planctomycetota bacterium]
MLFVSLATACAPLVSTSIPSGERAAPRGAEPGDAAALPAAPSGESARTAPAAPADLARRNLEFAVVKRYGPEGKGTETIAVEASLLATKDAGRTIELREMQDKIVSSQEAFSIARRELHLDAVGAFTDYRYHPGPQRSVNIVLDGAEVRVLNKDPLSRGHRHSLPSEMADARILEEDLIAPFQWAFDDLVARARARPAASERHPLDGARFSAIVAQDLQIREFELRAEGKEILRTARGEVATERLLVTSRRRGVAPLERRFWLDAGHAIVRMEEAPQERHHLQNSRTAYNLAYYPDAGGAYTEAIDFVPAGGGHARRALLPARGARRLGVHAHALERGPAILLLTPVEEHAPTRSRFVHRARWGLARRGVPVLSGEVGAASEDELLAVESMLEALRAHPAVDGARITLLAHEGTLALALRALERFELARLIAVVSYLPEDARAGARAGELFQPPRRRLLWVTRAAEEVAATTAGAGEAHRATGEFFRNAVPAERFSVLRLPEADAALWHAAGKPAREGDVPEMIAPAFFEAALAFVMKPDSE